MAIVLLASFASACGSDETKTTTVTEPSGSTTSSPPTETTEGVGSPGDPLAVDLSQTGEGGLIVKLVGFDSDPPAPDEVVYPLDPGHQWASVEVMVSNDSSVVSRQSAIEYLLVADDGQRVPATGANAFEPVISCCGSGYDGDSMQPGDRATGFVGFQVPDGVAPTMLRASDGLGGPVAEWTLK